MKEKRERAKSKGQRAKFFLKKNLGEEMNEYILSFMILISALTF